MMSLRTVCLRCFQYKGEFEVCPYCGFVEGTPPPEEYLLHPGTVLKDRYVIGVVLGYGGFGVTYKAYDANLGMVVAIKEFYPGGLVHRLPGESEVRVFPGEGQERFALQKARFLEEARNMARFNGEAQIVNVYDYYEANQTAYIIMEHLDGQTLKAYLAVVGGSLPEKETLRITGRVLKGLSSIHESGILHRDISPDNVFLLRDGRVKILDFGAAKLSGEERSADRRATVIKVGYTPPEQYHSKIEQGPWTDIYAVGATMYKMLTGVTPEESIDRTDKDLLKRPSRMGVRVSSDTEKVILTAMALRTNARYQTATAMHQALADDDGEEPTTRLRGRFGSRQNKR